MTIDLRGGHAKYNLSQQLAAAMMHSCIFGHHMHAPSIHQAQAQGVDRPCQWCLPCAEPFVCWLDCGAVMAEAGCCTRQVFSAGLHTLELKLKLEISAPARRCPIGISWRSLPVHSVSSPPTLNPDRVCIVCVEEHRIHNIANGEKLSQLLLGKFSGKVNHPRNNAKSLMETKG